jgi:hypothetical protein
LISSAICDSYNASKTCRTISAEKCEIIGRVDDNGLFSDTLVLAENGDVYGGSRWTRLFKYDLSEKRLVHMDVKAPVMAGRELYNRIGALVSDGGHIYGGTSADGTLFKFDPKSEKLLTSSASDSGEPSVGKAAGHDQEPPMPEGAAGAGQKNDTSSGNVSPERRRDKSTP